MVIKFMEKTVASILGWILMPVYWIRYPGAMIRGGCLIDIFTVTIKKNARVGCNSWIGPNVILEEYSILGRDAKISNVSIDKFTSIGADFKVLPYGHNYNRFSTFSFYILANPNIFFYFRIAIVNSFFIAQSFLLTFF